MQIRKMLSTLLAIVGITMFAPHSLAQSPLFSALSPPQPHEAGKVEVIEFFWYGCPHCYAIESSVNAWIKSKPADVVFKRVPTYNESWAPMVTLYYTLEAMGVLDQYHQKVFDAIHKGNPDQKLLAYQYLQTLPKIAEGSSNKLWIIPSEVGEALKGIGSVLGAGTAPQHQSASTSEVTPQSSPNGADNPGSRL